MKYIVDLEHFEEVTRLRFVASTDEARYHFTGVHLNFQSGMAEATDGHKAVRISLPKPMDDNAMPTQGSAIIPREACDEIAKAYKKKKSLALVYPVTVDLQAREITLDLVDTKRTWKLMDAKYPNFSQIIPVIREENSVEVAFQPKYLAQILEALKAEKRMSIVKIRFDRTDTMRPFMVSVEDKEAGICMPCRI